MSLFIKKVLFPVLVFVCIFALVLHIFKGSNKNPTDTVYTLKSYRNTVALYQNENLIEIFDSVVLNTLPQKDVQNFNNGIVFDTKEQAEIFLEDFE